VSLEKRAPKDRAGKVVGVDAQGPKLDGRQPKGCRLGEMLAHGRAALGSWDGLRHLIASSP
jgi:hypothetical protein